MKANRTVVALIFTIYVGLAIAVWAVPAGRFVLVVTNPAADPGYAVSVIADAEGAFVASGRFSWMTVAYSEDEDFSAKLVRAGAVLVLNHQLALGCLRGNEK